MASFAYPAGTLALLTGRASWADTSQTFEIALVGKAYRPRASHESAGDLAYELTGGNYRRRSIGGRELVVDGSQVRLIASAVTWPNLYVHNAYRWMVVLHRDTIDNKTRLIVAIDAGQDVNLDGVHEHTIKFDGRDKGGLVVAILAGKAGKG